MEKDHEEEKDCIFNKRSNKNKLNDYNTSVVKIRKRMLKTKIDGIDEVRVNFRSSALTNQDYEQ